MNRPNRRTFLGTMGAVAATSGLSRAWAQDAPSERVNLAILGVRSRGTQLAQSFVQDPGCRIVAVCDVDESMLGKPVEVVEKATGTAPRTERDFRRLLDDKEIDAVVIATPDHWHALMTVLACQAGKDVYVEKPVSHNDVEGRKMVEAARKYDRVVQAGTQRRSAESIKDAIEHVRSGAIGHVGMARAWIHQVRPSIGHAEPTDPPAGVDWALWQGPAPERPFIPNRFHYDWHWFWNWGTGEVGNNGIHGLDLARWGLGVDSPTHIGSAGGIYVLKDDRESPDTQIVTYEFPGVVLQWEHRMWSRHGQEGGANFGVAFYGDKGTLITDGGSWRVEDGEEAGGKATNPMRPHVADFLDAVRTRRRPNADIEIGHLSARLCHLGNIAHRVGRRLTFDAATESFPGDTEANTLLSREYSDQFAMPETV